ncbi:MAG: carboxypeptidase-like regulatory domain-containing protein [Saprospiraceae bacterium]|nr:carboxypeptidase-like regulatory domain-containing protein [Saprospiraceae bacterium]
MKFFEQRFCFTIGLFFLSFSILAQTGTIRGNVFDKESGEPIIYGNVLLQGTNKGTITNIDGFFTIADVVPGKYTLVATYIGYDSVAVDIEIVANKISYQKIELGTSAVQLGVVDVSGRREQARSEVQVSKIAVTPKEIRSLPSTGGEADIAQYLPVLPGIIVSGDQGGQLYIRGGSPIQNKILLDGMTIYNPFHSIGFFSVFETETIRSVDVLTGGFNAEHGGRISAVVDIKTREGNKKRLSGLVSASPFQAKALVEGPLKKAPEDGRGSSVSFLLTGKHSYLDQTSKALYNYATDTTFFSFASGDSTNLEDIGLPYQYTDIYGKLSFVGSNGSKLNLFGFNFADRFNLEGIANLDWNTFGAGANFTLIPPRSNIVMTGTAALSNYDIMLMEADGDPRSSSINSFSAILNFAYFGSESEINYGFEFNGFNTQFEFKNLFDVTFSQEDFTTEIAGYFKYRQKIGNLIIEPGVRIQFFASQSDMEVEPRLGLKYNITDNLRLKAAGGFYSQNLISTVSERDIVNFFVGFLAGPESMLFNPGTRDITDHNLQKAWHAVGGLEFDYGNNLQLNVEPYLKTFTQIININRNKLSEADPDFITETGEAYGVDFSVKYTDQSLYLWATYSLAYVNRNDGAQIYPTIFDRRHNINFLGTYNFGKKKDWEFSVRWNFGSAFPFTTTQGFYENVDFDQLLLTDFLTGNADIGTLLSGDLNDGRLSAYHRLDASLKKTVQFAKYFSMEAILSVTNVYNRENVFFVDRLTNNRVNQLPVLPSLGLTFKF